MRVVGTEGDEDLNVFRVRTRRIHTTSGYASLAYTFLIFRGLYALRWHSWHSEKRAKITRRTSSFFAVAAIAIVAAEKYMLAAARDVGGWCRRSRVALVARFILLCAELGD